MASLTQVTSQRKDLHTSSNRKSHMRARSPRAGCRMFASARGGHGLSQSVFPKSNGFRTHFNHWHHRRIAPAWAQPPTQQLVPVCHFQLLQTQTVNHPKPMQARAWLTSRELHTGPFPGHGHKPALHPQGQRSLTSHASSPLLASRQHPFLGN